MAFRGRGCSPRGSRLVGRWLGACAAFASLVGQYFGSAKVGHNCRFQPSHGVLEGSVEGDDLVALELVLCLSEPELSFRRAMKHRSNPNQVGSCSAILTF